MAAVWFLQRPGLDFPPATAACALIMLLMCARLLRAALAHFCGQVYSLHITLWYLLGAQLLGALVAIAGSGLLLLLAERLFGSGFSLAPGGGAHSLLAAVFTYPAAVYLAALLFREESASDPVVSA